jgi:hypothetical protein
MLRGLLKKLIIIKDTEGHVNSNFNYKASKDKILIKDIDGDIKNIN